MSRKTVYIGYDGAYVLSTTPLMIHGGSGCRFLAPDRGRCLDIQPQEARFLFGHLRLKKFDVVKMSIPLCPRVVKAKDAKK